MTRRILPLALLAALACTDCTPTRQNTSQTAKPADSSTVYVVSHIDVTPTHAVDTNKLLQQYVVDSLKDDGAVRVEAMVQDGRSNHFTLVEVWSNRAAFEAHTGLPHTRDFREKLGPYLGSPYDERLHGLL